MSEGKCKTCGCTPIAECGGKGFIRTGERTCKPCPHLYVKRLRTHLGPVISRAEHVKGSPLCTPPDVDRTGDNLLIQIASWDGLLPHLKWALACKGLTFSFKVVTDEDLRDVFVGSKAFKSMSVEQRAAHGYCNSINDLVSDPDLLIIQLGILRYKNVAISSVFFEALRIRERDYKPTWIVECDGTTLQSSQVYDTTVGLHVEEHYEALEIETDVESDDGFVIDDDVLDEAEAPSEHLELESKTPDLEDEEEEGSADAESLEASSVIDTFFEDKPKWRGGR